MRSKLFILCQFRISCQCFNWINKSNQKRKITGTVINLLDKASRMETVADEGSLSPNGEGELPVDVTELTPTSPAPSQPLVKLEPIQMPDSRRAEPIIENLPEKRVCLTRPSNVECLRCPICIENVRRRKPVATKCGHIFCKRCIHASIRLDRVCPLCRKRIGLTNFRRIFL